MTSERTGRVLGPHLPAGQAVTMPLLFAYGTLQSHDVQLETFGRILDGHPDELQGFELSRVRIEDPAAAAVAGRTHNVNVTFTGRPDSRVRGTVYEITAAELEAADGYEAPDDYVRMTVALASGRHAWVYHHGPSASAR